MQVPQEVAPNIQPSQGTQVYQHVDSTPNAFGGDIGTALNQTGNVIENYVVQQKKLLSEATARDIVTQGQVAIGAEQSKLASMSGSNAVNYQPDYVKNIQGIRDSTLNQAPDPYTRNLVDTQMARYSGNALVYGQMHIGEQAKVYANQTAAASVQANKDAVANAPDTQIQQSINDIVATNNRVAQQNGQPSAFAAAKTKLDISQALGSRFTSMAYANAPGAYKLFQQYRSQMDSQEANRTEIAINEHMLQQIPGTVSAGVLSGGDTATSQGRTNYGYSYFANKYGKNGAAGVMGSFIHESGGKLDPNAVNKGDGADGSDSIGIGQWNSDRAKALKAFAASRGESPFDYKTQLSFANTEISQIPGLAEKLRAAQTPKEAAEIFTMEFERPRGSQTGIYANVAGANDRVAYAEKLAALDPATVGVNNKVGPAQLPELLAQADAAISKFATDNYPDNPAMQQQLKARTEQIVRTKLYQQTEADNQVQRSNMNTVQGVTLNPSNAGKTVDELSSEDPNFLHSYAGLSALNQQRVNYGMAKLAHPTSITPDMENKYNTLVGMGTTNPREFLEVTDKEPIINSGLTISMMNKLNALHANILKNVNAPPKADRAMRLLHNWGITKFGAGSSAKPLFFGALSNSMEDFKQLQKRDPTDAEIKTMAQALLRPDPSTGFFGLFKSSYYQGDPDKAGILGSDAAIGYTPLIGKSLQDEYTKQGGKGIFNEGQLREIYLRRRGLP